jgi:phosphate transport system substrate-binding protein
MWQKDKKESSIVSLALLLALAASPIAVNLVLSESAPAQSPARNTVSFPLPQTVPNDIVIRIDGSSSMSAINQAIKERFEKQFAGARVEIATNGTEAALKALLAGQIDIAAIGRGLTPEEKAKGLEQVRLRREKIAIFVGAENPFQGSLTSRQFARIFRGQITDWSQLGRAAGKIRFIDRPPSSESRETFRTYPAFERAKFETGTNAIRLSEDNTAEVVKQLGKDGISYALANQVSKLKGVRILKIHNTLPDDPRYPFSQPLVYAYRKNPSPNTSRFLGFVTNTPGKQAVEAAMIAQAEAIANSLSQPQPFLATPTTSPATTPIANNTTTPPSPKQEIPTTTTSATETQETTTKIATSVAENTQIDQNQKALWLALPALGAVGAGGLILWLLRRRPKTQKQDKVTSDSQADPTKEVVKVASPAQTNVDNNYQITQNHSYGKSTAPTTGSPLPLKSSQTADTITENTALDLEAPVAVVNKSYTPLPDTPLVPTTESEQLKTAVHNTTQDLYPALPDVWEDISSSQAPDIPEVSLALEQQPPSVESTDSDIRQQAPDIPEVSLALEQQPPSVESTNFVHQQSHSSEVVAKTEYPPLPDVWEDTSTEEESTSEVPISTSELEPSAAVNTCVPELPDISELESPQQSSQNVSTSSSNTLEDTDINSKTDSSIGPWAVIYGIDENQNPSVDLQTSTSEPIVPSQHLDGDNSIVLQMRTPKWAYVSWRISEQAKQNLKQQGGSQFALRLYDVTGIDLSYQTPVVVRQYECEETINDRYVAIPASDRDYMAELGYLTGENHWLSLARSAIVRIFSRPEKNFWFIADVELIVHGATEPGSSVDIGGHLIKLKPDGTFHLRIPFTNNSIEYAMKATAADGQQTKFIRMKFFQDTSTENLKNE